MDTKLIENLKEKLLQEKHTIQGILETFAKKDPHAGEPENYESRFPKFDDTVTDEVETANEVNEYGGRIALEHDLEKRLVEIDEALEKIEKDPSHFGICAKCGNLIPEKILMTNPVATWCRECKVIK